MLYFAIGWWSTSLVLGKRVTDGPAWAVEVPQSDPGVGGAAVGGGARAGLLHT
jgi:hypothetical protein